MAKGIIYIMTSVVPGLIKIGKTNSDGFESRMYHLEHNGYCNITGLKRSFAIEVEDYNEKETMLHSIFQKSRVGDTEMFALDVNLAIQLLSSFDGEVIFPKTESKEEIFDEATDNGRSKIIPDGIYVYSRNSKKEGKVVSAKARIVNGNWTLLKGSNLALNPGVGVSSKAVAKRLELALDKNGILLEDTELGECSPSFAGAIVVYAANDGWREWRDSKGNMIEIYRDKLSEENDK